MSVVSGVFIVVGAVVALLAAIGMLRFRTPYARFHSAGKASPVAFIFVAVGAAIELGWSGAAALAVAAASLVLTLPVAVHLLFRAVHRTTPGHHFEIDELAAAERRGRD